MAALHWSAFNTNIFDSMFLENVSHDSPNVFWEYFSYGTSETPSNLLLKNCTFSENYSDDATNDIIIDDVKNTPTAVRFIILDSTFSKANCNQECSAIFIKNVLLTDD